MNNREVQKCILFVLLFICTNGFSQSISKRPNNTHSSTQTINQHKRAQNEIINELLQHMKFIVGGSITIGATPGQIREVADSAIPPHMVVVANYYIGQYEVTQEEWESVMHSNPSNHKNPKFPVENVSYNDCIDFIRKLNAITNKTFRLPTEAEWEYAAREGSSDCTYRFAGSDHINDVAWNKENSNGMTHKVGTKTPNALNIYDMSGNVWEWCSDWYSPYNDKKQINPTGPSIGNSRIIRGGGWGYGEWHCQVSYRQGLNPASFNDGLGFRLAMSSK